MNKYNTKQKEEILNLLNQKDQLLSAKQIHHLINKDNSKTGLTTIYRYLNYLEKENKIKKYIENNEAKYLLIVHPETEEIYIKCDECNKLIYFDCNEIKQVKNHLQNHHNIIWDFAKSNMIGKCVEC